MCWSICIYFRAHALFIWQLASFLNEHAKRIFLNWSLWNGSMTLKKKVKQTSYTIHLYLYFCLAYPLCSTFQFRRRKNSQKWNETKTVGCKIRQVESKRCSARNQLENIPQHYIRISDGKNSTWFICLMFVACVILSALHFSSLHFNCRNWSGNSPMELANACNAMQCAGFRWFLFELSYSKWNVPHRQLYRWRLQRTSIKTALIRFASNAKNGKWLNEQSVNK